MSMLEEEAKIFFPRLSHFVDKKIETQGKKETGPRSESKCVADVNLNPGIWTPGSVSYSTNWRDVGGETVTGWPAGQLA